MNKDECILSEKNFRLEYQFWQKEIEVFIDHIPMVIKPFGLELKEQSAEWQFPISP
jgi:hypothetical protein